MPRNPFDFDVITDPAPRPAPKPASMPANAGGEPREAVANSPNSRHKAG
jgi:hypothetical protein